MTCSQSNLLCPRDMTHVVMSSFETHSFVGRNLPIGLSDYPIQRIFHFLFRKYYHRLPFYPTPGATAGLPSSVVIACYFGSFNRQAGCYCHAGVAMPFFHNTCPRLEVVEHGTQFWSLKFPVIGLQFLARAPGSPRLGVFARNCSFCSFSSCSSRSSW
jgi:hypothetical protein